MLFSSQSFSINTSYSYTCIFHSINFSLLPASTQRGNGFSRRHFGRQLCQHRKGQEGYRFDVIGTPVKIFWILFYQFMLDLLDVSHPGRGDTQIILEFVYFFSEELVCSLFAFWRKSDANIDRRLRKISVYIVEDIRRMPFLR